VWGDAAGRHRHQRGTDRHRVVRNADPDADPDDVIRDPDAHSDP
jgi:hypothetical protein